MKVNINVDPVLVEEKPGNDDFSCPPPCSACLTLPLEHS